MTPGRFVFTGFVALAVVMIAGCDETPSPRELVDEIRVDKTQIPRAAAFDPCDELIGMRVCTEEYALERAECVAYNCEQGGGNEAAVEWCWEQGYGGEGGGGWACAPCTCSNGYETVEGQACGETAIDMVADCASLC
jgi:hypothetical protein